MTQGRRANGAELKAACQHLNGKVSVDWTFLEVSEDTAITKGNEVKNVNLENNVLHVRIQRIFSGCILVCRKDLTFEYT